MVIAYTDGANSAKNKVGGCAAIITKDSQILAELADGYDNNPTNNMMELGGVILACQYMLDHPELGKDITIVSDSEYVVLGARDRLDKWKLKNWRTVTKELVKNKVLWEAIDYLKSQLNITWKWTKGHNGDTLNELADVRAVESYKKLIK
jgi:ribonuclease HI